jgi:catechol 2,3-dioxygenase
MSTTASTPSKGASINHLVLAVRDLEKSHRFYTDVLGFEQCGELNSQRNPAMRMKFYRGSEESHHDIALIEVGEPQNVEPAGSWVGFAPKTAVGLNHLAIGYPSPEAWKAQLAHMQNCGVAFEVRGNHGMTHSAYISDPDGNGLEIVYNVPREQWENDVNAALNYFSPLPQEGPDALQDPDGPVFG